MTHITVLDANPWTFIIIAAATSVTPVYLLATYHFSGASSRKGLLLAGIWLVFGALMSWMCIAGIPDSLGPAGSLLIPAAWLLPSLLLWWGSDWALSEPLSQHWMVGLQIWRVVGGVFLLEYWNGHIPALFAFPAGIGDLAVGLLAVLVLLFFGRRLVLPRVAIIAVIALGVLDFASAFFFGFTTSNSPGQLFYPEIENQTLHYPTGMIPLFLVPYAIFFHTLSYLSLKRASAN